MHAHRESKSLCISLDRKKEGERDSTPKSKMYINQDKIGLSELSSQWETVIVGISAEHQLNAGN